MYVTKDKKLALNTDLVQMVRLADDGSVTLALGGNAVTLEGEDAEACAKQFGLSSEKNDKSEKHEAHPAAAAKK